jgi:DNA-binding MarR family transcriptional regulator
MNIDKNPLEKAVDTLGEDGFGLLLHRVKLELVRLLERELSQSNLGLNFTQYRVLMMLDRTGVMTASELAKLIDHDAGALTRLLDRLIEQGYVRRAPSERDRRVANLSLTEEGRAMVKPMREIANSLVCRAMSDLSPDEQRTLTALLKRVRITLESLQ